MIGLADLFLGAFLFGLIFTLISVLLGGHFGLGQHAPHLPGPHLGHWIHLGHGAHVGHGLAGGQAVAGGAAGHAGPVGPGGHGSSSPHGSHGAQQRDGSLSPWNLTALTAFVAWFGGAGYLALTAWEVALWPALVLAVVAGLFGWGVVQWFFTRVLLGRDLSLDPADYRCEGTLARVTAPIVEGRTGEIHYTLGGVRHSDGARSARGGPIPRDAEVVIVYYERGIAYVEPWQSFVEGESTRPGPDEA